MAQNRRWNYQDDDSTYDLNQRENGIFPPGRYRGFDPVLGGTMVLTLEQGATAATRTADDGLTEEQFGIWYSKQGVVVTEDDDLLLPVDNGDGQDRIDLIVAQHQYIFSAGGAAAIYLVIKGTPAASPVAPALTLPSQQVVLGQIYVPAGTTALTDVGVAYTQAVVPDFGADSTIVHADRENTFTELQTFKTKEMYLGLGTMVSGSGQLDLTDTAANSDSDIDYYLITTVSGYVAGSYEEITSFSPAIAYSGGADRARLIYLYNGSVAQLKFAASLVNRDLFVEPGRGILLSISISGIRAISGDEAMQGTVNKFQRMQIFNSGTATLPPSAELALSNGANIFFASNNASNDEIRAIQGSSNYNASSAKGGVIWLTTSTNNLTITPFDFAIPTGYKPLRTQNGLPLVIKGEAAIALVEDAVYWNVVEVAQAYQDAPVSLTPQPSGTVTGTGSVYRYCVKGNTCHIQFFTTITISNSVNQILLDLPTGIVPANAAVTMHAGSGYLFDGSLPTPLIVTVFPGNRLSIYYYDGSGYPSVNNRLFSISATFEIA